MHSIYFAMLDSEADRKAFEKIYNDYRYRMYNSAFKILHNIEDSEDAVNNAFMYIAKNFKNLTSKSVPKMEASFVIIIRRASIDIYRKNKKRSEHIEFVEDIEEVEDDEANVELDFFEKFDYDVLRKNIRKLPDIYKDAVYLCYREEYSVNDAAEMLGITPSAVYKRIENAKKELKKYLIGEHYE